MAALGTARALCSRSATGDGVVEIVARLRAEEAAGCSALVGADCSVVVSCGGCIKVAQLSCTAL